MKEYHVGIYITRSVYTFIDAENEEQAKELALQEVEDRTEGCGAFVTAEVYFSELYPYAKNGESEDERI
jgi:hypothetical protein